MNERKLEKALNDFSPEISKRKKIMKTHDDPVDVDDVGNLGNLTETDYKPVNMNIGYPFKNPSFVHSSKGAQGAKKYRVWKSLKQVIVQERSSQKQQSSVTYSGIDAPPSFKPPSKYSDISGLEAPYTDPQTKLRYTTSDEYSQLHLLPADIVTGYLTLRKANPIVS